MLARLLLVAAVALLTLHPAEGRAQPEWPTPIDGDQSWEIVAEGHFRCRFQPIATGLHQFCWDDTATTPSLVPTFEPDAGEWYACWLTREDGYIRSDCLDRRTKWAQITPTGW